MASTMSKNIQLAQALPARLRTFLARYPPVQLLPTGANPDLHKTAYQEETPNPFAPMKHPITGKWHDPKYSLRRQAELVKLAREHGVEELLPYTPKGTEERIRKRVELGLRVKGTGVGQQVKGHKHERQLVAKWVYPRGMKEAEDADQVRTGWRRGERPCWKCRISSGNGRRYVLPASVAEDLLLIHLINTGWKAQMGPFPKINDQKWMWKASLGVNNSLCIGAHCTNKYQYQKCTTPFSRTFRPHMSVLCLSFPIGPKGLPCL